MGFYSISVGLGGTLYNLEGTVFAISINFFAGFPDLWREGENTILQHVEFASAENTDVARAPTRELQFLVVTYHDKKKSTIKI